MGVISKCLAKQPAWKIGVIFVGIYLLSAISILILDLI